MSSFAIVILMASAAASAGGGALEEMVQMVELTASDGFEYDLFGRSVSGAGDLNGDGYDDVIVGTHNYQSEWDIAGSAYVYLGGEGGVTAASEIDLSAPNSLADDAFGLLVSGAGDLDGDGYDDLLIGATAGAVYLFPGGIDGVDVSAATALVAPDEGRSLTALSGAGDLDGDGYDDALVGLADYGGGGSAVYVYQGAGSGDAAVIASPEGEDDDFFGYALSGAGDVDGDGRGDVLVGAGFDDDGGDDAGAVYVFSGGEASEWQELIASDPSEPVHFGEAVSGAGDVDGDGYDDVLVGAPLDGTVDIAAGAAYVFLGGAGGIDAGSELKLVASDGAREDYFGDAVSGAGDVDGDGRDDVLVGAWEEETGVATGSAYVFLGSADGIDSTTEIILHAADRSNGDRFGFAVSGAGDVNGDGAADVLIGAHWSDDDGESSGSAYLFAGDCGDRECANAPGCGCSGAERAAPAGFAWALLVAALIRRRGSVG